MVPNLIPQELVMFWGTETRSMNDDNLPKSLLDASHVILAPVTPGHVFLADRNALPGDAHDGNVVDIVLVKLNVELRVVTGRPLVQSPGLNNLLGLFQLKIFSRDVAVKELKLASCLCSLKHLWRRPSEGGQSLRVDKGLIQLLSSGAELLVVTHCYRVDNARTASVRSCGLSCSLWCSLGEGSRGREAAGRVGAGGMLDILSMLSDQGTSKFLKLFSELRNKL